MLKSNGVDVPVVSLQGIQWMTVSDGNYTISATLNPDLKHVVESGLLRENSIFEINGYTIEDNQDETYAGRHLML